MEAEARSPGHEGTALGKSTDEVRCCSCRCCPMVNTTDGMLIYGKFSTENSTKETMPKLVSGSRMGTGVC